MIVSELIEKLKEFDQTLNVRIYADRGQEAILASSVGTHPCLKEEVGFHTLEYDVCPEDVEIGEWNDEELTEYVEISE